MTYLKWRVGDLARIHFRQKGYIFVGIKEIFMNNQLARLSVMDDDWTDELVYPIKSLMDIE